MFLLIADKELFYLHWHWHCTRFKLSQFSTTQGLRVFSHFSSRIVGRAKLQGGKERNKRVRVKITPSEKGDTPLEERKFDRSIIIHKEIKMRDLS